MKRRGGFAVLAVLGVVAVVPAVGAAPSPVGPIKSLLSAEGEQQLQDALERSRAADRSRAQLPRGAPRRFAGLSNAEALRTATDQLPGLFAARPTRLLAPRPNERVERYLGDYGARMDVPGEADAIISSDLPLRVDVDGEKQPVDLVLVDRGDHLAPATPLVGATFPDVLRDPLTVGGQIALRLVGADPAATGVQAGQQVFYANALRDADLLATPLPTGLETFVQLRSPDSPKELGFEFGLPAGARLDAQTQDGKATGAIAILRGDEQIGRVQPPSATDARGAPVAVATTVVGSTLTLSVDVGADAAYPVLVDPIVEGQYADLNDVNAGFTHTRGWRRDSSVGVAAFNFVPNTDSPDGDGTQCIRIRNDGTLEVLDHAICVGTYPTLNYPYSSTFSSIGAWTWRPPAGVRSSANDVPAPNTDAFVYRADVRNGYVDYARAGGNTAMVAGLISGRTQTWIGTYGVTFATSPPNGVGGNSPFLLDWSQSSFIGTYCARSDCSAELNDPAYDGTYMAFGVWAAGTGQQASSIGQGAALSQSDRSAPLVAHVPVSDAARWYSGGTFTSRATATDAGMGMYKLGVLFDRVSLPQYTDEVRLACDGTSAKPCPKTIAATNFTYGVSDMPEGRNTVSGVGVDILSRVTSVPMTSDGLAGSPQVHVKVDKTKPVIAPSGLSGSLHARNGRAVTDGSYTLTATVNDSVSGVEVIGYTLDGGAPVLQPAQSCPNRDCPPSATATFTFDTASLSAGQHVLNVYAKDSAGNELNDPAVRFVVDHAAPTITTLTHAPALTGWFGARTMTATATATDDASGVKRFTLTTPKPDGSTTSADTVVSGCDDTIANTCPLSVTRDLTYTTAAIGDGAARPVSLTATDALGQTSTPPRQWQVNVDTAGPALTLSGAAWNARDGYIAGGPQTLQAAAVDSVAGQQRSGVARITMRIDHPPPDLPIDDSITQTCTSTPTQPCDLSGSLTVPGDLPDGEHTIYVSATDNAEPANTTTTSFVLYVDQTAPTITSVTHDPAPPATWRDDVPRVATVGAHDDLSGVASVTLTLPTIGMPQTQTVACAGSRATPCPRDTSATFDYETAALAQGPTTASVTARDRADNVSAASEWSLNVDRTAPTATYSGSLTQLGGQVLLGGSHDLRVDAADAYSGVRSIRFFVDDVEKLRKDGACSADGCPPRLSETLVVSPRDYAPLTTHTVRVEIADQVGAPAERHVATATYTFVNGPAGPTDETAAQNTLGFEEWLSYDDHATGAGSSAHVNLASGNSLWTHTFLSNPGRGINSSGRLTYNSHEPGLLNGLPLVGGVPVLNSLAATDYNQAGRGVSMQITGVTRLNEPLDLGLTLDILGLRLPPTQVKLTDGDGTRHTFVDQGNGSFQGPAGVHLRFQTFSSDPQRIYAMTRPDGLTYFFDIDGYLRQIEDRVGNVMTYVYEDVPLLEKPFTQCGANPLTLELGCARRVTAIVDASGRAPENAANRSVHIAYSNSGAGRGMIESIADHGGRVTRFGYDNQRRLTTLTQDAGTAAAATTRAFALGYAGDTGYLTRVADPRGNASQLAQEDPGLLPTSLRKMSAFADRLGRATTYGYAQTTLDGATVQNTAITDPKRRLAQVRTDGRQRTIEVIDARSKRDRWIWDDAVNKPSRQIQAVGTADEAITKSDWGSLGQPLKSYAPFKAADEASARVTTFEYHVFSGLFAPGEASTTPIVYDQTKMTPPKGSEFATSWQVDDQGRVQQECLPATPCSAFTYGSGGLLIKDVDPQGNATEYLDHDASGLPRRTLDKRGEIWQRRYDDVGNVIAVRDPRGAAAAPSEDLPARSPFTARFSYDALDRKLGEVIPKQSIEGRYVQRSFAYDSNDNRTTVTDGVGAVWKTTFTATDQVKAEQSPAIAHHDNPAAEVEEAIYDYDATDNVVALHRPESRGGGGFETRYGYDLVDQRVVQRQVSSEAEPASGIGQLVQSWAFDLRGNTIGVADAKANGEVDDATAAANAADPAKQRFAYRYDAADRKLAQTEDPDGLKLTTSYSHDDNDNLASEVSPRGNESGAVAGDFTTRYEYDRRDLKTGEVDPLGRRTTWDLRADGKIVGVTTPRGSETSTAGDFTTKFDYDAAGDLKTHTQPRRPGQYGPDALTITYTRDAVGDPTTIKDARGRSFTNAFLDSGELRETTRPSWWTWDEAAGAARERDASDGPPADRGRDLPSSSGAGDFGAVDAQDVPGVLPRAGRTVLFYDDELRLSSVRDAAGNAQSFTYDLTGRMTRREIPFKPGAAVPTCSPGVRGQEPAEGPIAMRWAYDRNGNVRSMLDGRCQETNWSYDQFDRLARSSQPAGWDGTRGVSEQKFDRNGNVLSRTNPRSADAVERMTYDDVDRLVSRLEPFDATEDSPRSEWRYRYDANGNQLREIRPRSAEPGADLASFTTVMTYDRADQLTKVANGADHVTEYGYDADGNQTDVSAPGAARSDSALVLPRVTHTEYEGRGLPWISSAGSGDDRRTTITEYDGNGNLRRSVNAKGVTTVDRPRYDDIAEHESMSTISRASWNATVNEYDADDLMTASYLPWDDSDNNERFKQQHTYNARGWPEAVSGVFKWTGSNSADFETRYDYLPTGWVKTSIDKPLDGGLATQTLDYDYDHGGNQTLWASPGKTRRVERTFFPNGELEQRKAIRTTRDGVPVDGEAGTDSETRTYEYGRNRAGELTALIDKNPPRPSTGPTPAQRTTQIARDVAGRARKINEDWDGGRDTVYHYAVGGLVDDVSVDGAIDETDGSYAGGRKTTYGYDILDRVDDVAVKESGADTARHTRFTYWPSNEQRTVTKTNQTTEERFYSTDGLLAGRTVEPGQDGSVAQAHSYTYDANANRTTDERGAFEYNARDQLTRWTPADPLPGGPTAVRYEPGGDGRIDVKTETYSGGVTRTTSNTYSGEQLTTAEVRTTGAGGDGNDDLKFDYDIFGSLLTIGKAPAGTSNFETSTQYTYDPFERLLSSRDDTDDDGAADGPHTVYCYDALDRRDRKVTGVADVDGGGDSFAKQREACRNPTVGQQTLDYSYLGLGEQLTRELTPTKGPRTYDYTPDGTRLGVRLKTPTGDHAFHPYEFDAQGSVYGVETAAPSSGASDRYRYDPYGETLNEESLGAVAKDNPFRYQSFYRDAESKTYDMYARAYRPSLGRFLSQDRFQDPSADLTLQQNPLTNNRYTFLAGNPTNALEIDGHYWGEKWVKKARRAAKRARRWVNNRIIRPGVAAAQRFVRKAPGTVKRGVQRTAQQLERVAVAAVSVAADAGGAVAHVAAKVAAPALDLTQTALGVVGFVPVLGEVADLANAGVSLARGDHLGAVMWLGAAMPFTGWASGAINVARTGQRAFRTISGLASGINRGARSTISRGRRAPGGSPRSASAAGTRSRGCNSFAAATLVLMADGTQKPISQVRIGDWVLATDPATGNTQPRQVTDVIVGTGHKQLIRIIAAGRQIVATDNHPFYTANNHAWTNAADLRQDDQLLAADGTLIAVSTLIDADTTTTAYNLTVDADHTYYAGQQPVLVHNCGGSSGAKGAHDGLDAARRARDAAGRHPDGRPNRDSPVYVGGQASDGRVMGTGNGPGPNALHAEDLVQRAMPGARMTEPYAWRRGLNGELEWQPFTVCPRCQGNYPRGLFEPGTRGAPGGPWGD